MGLNNPNDPKELAEAVSRFVNGSTSDGNAFIEAMATEHRTLQQCFTNICFAWLRECAKKYEDKNYDARNEWSCKKAHEIMEKVEDVAYDCPFI
jgi:hypothetical protein